MLIKEVILCQCKQFFVALTAFVLALLPTSPFDAVANGISQIPYLQYLNWFFPVTECVAVFEVWLVCVATFYVYQGYYEMG